ncbi:hypothetical protein GQR58_009844 [Nymphon striatum]|nr:hypothetical protein GQR58_009844 [Nymphon striatum]
MQSHMSTIKPSEKSEAPKASNNTNHDSVASQKLDTAQIRSPDSTIIDSDCLPTSSTHSISVSSKTTQGMSKNDQFNSPPKKEMSPNSKSTPQSSSKNDGKPASKRKLFSSPGVSQEEDGMDNKSCTPRRKKVDNAGTTPKSAARLAMPFSERQQMAMVMQMTANSGVMTSLQLGREGFTPNRGIDVLISIDLL